MLLCEMFPLVMNLFDIVLQRLLAVSLCLCLSVDLDPEDERLLEDDMGAPSDAKRFVP